MYISGVVLLYDNVHSRTVVATGALLEHFNMEFFDHPA
jgi:hypothetical protein